MRLFDIRVTVEAIEGRSVCGLQGGDYFEVTESNRVRIPEGNGQVASAPDSIAAESAVRRLTGVRVVDNLVKVGMAARPIAADAPNR